jgi:SEC-C motif domain protein
MTASPADKPSLTFTSPCPCGSGKTFGLCCEPLLKQQRTAATAEELMRSRFAAHAVRDYRHLHRTYLATAHKPFVEETGEGAEIAWTRLVVHASEPDPKPDHAFVDFSAYFKDGDTEQAMHEKAEFTRVNGVWYYSRTVRSGPAPVRSSQAKVGRNEPCPCGSGRKFKHCCGR